MYVNRKPLNQLESPVYPFIQKDQPRSYFVEKHWTVDTGDVLRRQSNNTQIFDGSILAVSRDENKNRYGATSFHPKVNKEFRPPLVDPEYDRLPLSRIPRPRTQLRINPDPSNHYEKQNVHGMDVTSMVDDRIMHAAVRPSFTIALEKPIDIVLPTLKFNRPQVRASTSMNTPIRATNNNTVMTLEKHTPDVYVQAGNEVPLRFDAVNGIEYLNLDLKNPMVQALAGTSVPFSDNNITRLDDINLDYKNPQVGVESGKQSQFTYLGDTATEYRDLAFNRPQTSMRVNAQCDMKSQSFEPQMIKLQTPIQIGYQATKNMGMERNLVNDNPMLRPTLTFNRAVDSCAVIPKRFDALTPTLKGKFNARPMSGY